ncbi:hypothetical protein [Dictyobacter formicarum]|uniref:hypothetical protein n=1 Tax=Dictyobacter formicarum TaxID=2778368 RepID=UPI001916729D|nr:hypothetical protein [Dictyobacter formicarum]
MTRPQHDPKRHHHTGRISAAIPADSTVDSSNRPPAAQSQASLHQSRSRSLEHAPLIASTLLTRWYPVRSIDRAHNCLIIGYPDDLPEDLFRIALIPHKTHYGLAPGLSLSS